MGEVERRLASRCPCGGDCRCSRKWTCCDLPAVLLEAGYSARSAGDHDELIEGLLALPHISMDEGVERRAIDAPRQLALAGHDRLPPVDLILAAIADRHGLGVLHYDRGFDLLRSKTDLDFESVWLAPRSEL